MDELTKKFLRTFKTFRVQLVICSKQEQRLTSPTFPLIRLTLALEERMTSTCCFNDLPKDLKFECPHVFGAPMVSHVTLPKRLSASNQLTT